MSGDPPLLPGDSAQLPAFDFDAWEFCLNGISQRQSKAMSVQAGLGEKKYTRVTAYVIAVAQTPNKTLEPSTNQSPMFIIW